MTAGQWGWLIFALFVLGMIALDLGVFHRRAHEVTLREAMTWSAVWIFLALGFNAWIFFSHPRGNSAALEFLTGYLLEQSLSVDNLFVFLLIFHYFQVKGRYQHRVLFWGIFGALVMRAGFIACGVVLLHMVHWIIYVFGGLLIVSGIKLALQNDKKVDPERNPLLRLVRRLVPITPAFVEGKFFVRQDGKRLATPLFVVLVAVETTDLVFAVDSIPAILAVTRDPFIVYTSNVFAILGLRSMYFALAGLLRLFHYLHYGLALVLIFVGAKMLLSAADYEVPIGVTLGVVAGVLALSVVASVFVPSRKEDKAVEALGREVLAADPAIDSSAEKQTAKDSIQARQDSTPPSDRK
jgi:tellurite resistance protein TerC